jgi:hypothetical protein
MSGMLRRFRRSGEPPLAARRLLALFALLLAVAVASAPSAVASTGAFITAYGWGVADGMSRLETCTTTCEAGFLGGGAGELYHPVGVATDSSGDVYVGDTLNQRIDEFSSAGAFIKAYGWGVSDGQDRFETCTSTCQTGILGGGAGQLYAPRGVAVDPSGDVYVADLGNARIDEFSAAGAFISAYGWGVADGQDRFETCTSSCQAGIVGGGAGQLNEPWGVAVDPSGDVYVADTYNSRIDQFSSAGAFIKAYGWGVSDGASRFETCTSTCQAGLYGGGAGQLDGAPEGVATDSSGDVYVADFNNNRIDEFSAAGAFVSAYGWGVADGQDQFETCTATCQTGIEGVGAGALVEPTAVAIDPSGDVYVAEYGNDRIDEFSAAGAFIGAYGWGVADGQYQFETCTSTCRSGLAGGGAGQLYIPYGVATDSAGDVYVAEYLTNRIDEFSAAGALSPAPPVSPTHPAGPTPPASPAPSVSPAPPVNTTRPEVTGSAKAGATLSCSRGTWNNDPTTFADQWYRDGTSLAGFTGSTYRLGTLDEGTTLMCVVTASSAAGQASAHSNAVTIPIPTVPRCAGATGSMTGTTIGQVTLGMTRSQARYLYRHHSNRGRQYEDFFCLTPIGVRVGYASPVLLDSLPSHQRPGSRGRVVWASTSDPYYSLDGIRAGESIATAARVLGAEPPFHIGLNDWYLARKAGYTAVLKVRGGVVEELGIADNSLTGTRTTQNVLMHSFY